MHVEFTARKRTRLGSSGTARARARYVWGEGKVGGCTRVSGMCGVRGRWVLERDACEWYTWGKGKV